MQLKTLARMKRRRSQGGAVFVEALIVIASFCLFLLGLKFFHSLYVTELKLLRIARASTIAYSMGGCTDNKPADWARKDLAKSANVRPNTTNVQQPTKEARPVTGSTPAQNVVRNLPGTGTDNSVLNPIGSVALADKASAIMTSGPMARRSGFTKDLNVSSHVTCGDKVRDGDFGEIVGVVTKQFPK